VTRIYRREDVQKPDWKLIAEVRYPAAPIEGVCWDGRDLVLVAEGGAISRIAEKTWRDSTPRRSSVKQPPPQKTEARPSEPARKAP
jgi:hypothetical protein